MISPFTTKHPTQAKDECENIEDDWQDTIL